MKRRKLISIFITVVLLAGIFSGCDSDSSASYSFDYDGRIEMRNESNDIILDHNDFVSAKTIEGSNDGQYLVQLTFTNEGRQKFKIASAEYAGKSLNFFVGNTLIFSAVVREGIESSEIVVSRPDQTSKEEVDALAENLNKNIKKYKGSIPSVVETEVTSTEASTTEAQTTETSTTEAATTEATVDYKTYYVGWEGVPSSGGILRVIISCKEDTISGHRNIDSVNINYFRADSGCISMKKTCDVSINSGKFEVAEIKPFIFTGMVDADGQITVTISSEHEKYIIRDTEFKVDYENIVSCSGCKGYGQIYSVNINGTSSEPCGRCDGLGVVVINKEARCKNCNGTGGGFELNTDGKNYWKKCQGCGGTGAIDKNHWLLRGKEM